MVRLIVLSAIVYFWFRYFRASWKDLDASRWSVEWSSTLLSGLMILIGYVLLGVLWAPLCREIVGLRLSPLNAFRISALAWMGRYIPGKIWAVVGKAYLTTSDKSRVASAGVAAGVDSVLLQLSGLLLALVVLPFAARTGVLPPNAAPMFAALLIVALVGVHPRVFYPIVNTILRVLRLAPLQSRARYWVLLAIMLGYVAVFALWSTGFAVFAGSVTPLRPGDLLVFWVITPVAWTVGFFSLFAPAGIGVRDSILALGLIQLLHADPTAVVVVVIGTRLLTTIVEFVCFLIALLLSSMGLAQPT